VLELYLDKHGNQSELSLEKLDASFEKYYQRVPFSANFDIQILTASLRSARTEDFAQTATARVG
jgi:hypothetical protein